MGYAFGKNRQKIRNRKSAQTLRKEFTRREQAPMRDLQVYLEGLLQRMRSEAAEFKLVSDSTTEPTEKASFEELASSISSIADQVEQLLRDRALTLEQPQS